MPEEINVVMQAMYNFGIPVVLLAYFMFRDYKFMGQLQTTLTTLVNTVNTLKEWVDLTSEKGDKNET